VDIASGGASKIIGWHGETLNSIQQLLKAMIRSMEKLEKSPFLVLDVDGYRRAQEERVCEAAARKADFVRRTGNRVALPPMSPYFRRVVHLYVSRDPALQDLTTVSTGEGDYRQIVLCLKESTRGSEELTPVLADDEDLKDALKSDSLENLDV
jgi:spoIIIJ-associated protein